MITAYYHAGFAAPIGDAVINSGPGLMLIVEKQLGANTLTVTRGVEQALQQAPAAQVPLWQSSSASQASPYLPLGALAGAEVRVSAPVAASSPVRQ